MALIFNMKGATGAAGATGATGAAGANGSNGANGAPGSTWYNGTGAPNNALGIDGDYYIDNATQNVYHKVAGSW